MFKLLYFRGQKFVSNSEPVSLAASSPPLGCKAGGGSSLPLPSLISTPDLSSTSPNFSFLSSQVATYSPVFRIRISLNADPDPGFYLNADPDSGFWTLKT